MSHKSLWLVEIVITAIVLLVVGSVMAPQMSSAAVNDVPAAASSVGQ